MTDIHEIRTGHETDTFKNSKVKNKYKKENCFSLIVGAENHTINLVAGNRDEARLWVQGLGWAQKKAQNVDVKAKQASYPLNLIMSSVLMILTNRWIYKRHLQILHGGNCLVIALPYCLSVHVIGQFNL